MAPPPLPPFFTPPIISSIHWPLGNDSSPPLFFQSLEELKYQRRKGQHGCSSHLQLLDPYLEDLPGTIETYFPSPRSASSNIPSVVSNNHFGLLSLALVLLGHGYTDECHNIITPYSWPDDIHFAHGPSIYHQVSPEIKVYATYIHCLVHRREAFNVGEFGMVGFDNANYWSNAVKQLSRSPESNSILPHKELGTEVVRIAESYENMNGNFNDNDKDVISKWCQRHGFENVNTIQDDQNYYFESRAIHQLCGMVLQQQQQQDESSNERRLLRQFAGQVVSSEIKILLKHTLQLAGYNNDDIPSNDAFHVGTVSNVDSSTTSSDTSAAATTTAKSGRVTIDEDIALSAAKKVSSAHLQNFISNGSIILRRIVEVVENTDADDTKLLYSATAGIACRLLQSPACKLVMADSPSSPPKTGNVLIRITVKTRTSTDGNDDNVLSPGDCLAELISMDGSSDDETSTETSSSSSSSNTVLIWETYSNNTSDGHNKEEVDVIFVDRLYGTRGETPTTVIQWSKGTIF